MPCVKYSELPQHCYNRLFKDFVCLGMEKKDFMVNPLSNLQEAIDEAQKNLSVVEFTTGNYFVDKPLVISKPVLIRGNGSTIRGGHNGVVFDIKDEANVPDTEIRDCIIIPFNYST